MAKSVNQLVTAIKENGEDFEWYPTTQEIVNALQKHLKATAPKCYGTWSYNGKVLDVGCGNGSFFEKFCNSVIMMSSRMFKSLELKNQIFLLNNFQKM